MRVLDGEDTEIPDAFAICTPEGLQAIRRFLSEEALQTPVVFTERLSNRVLAVHLVIGIEGRVIAVNSRFRVDPDVLIHALLEEFVHTEQVLDKVDFEAQRRQFAYQDRPYEQEAKRIATQIPGYDPDEYDVYLIREEPEGILYDRSV
jgi:hypothetical protein